MPIPTRTQSPSRTDPAGENPSPDAAPQPAPQTRLANNVFKPRPQPKPDATTTRQAREPRLGIPRRVPASTPVSGHARNLSTASVGKGPAKDAKVNASHVAMPKPVITSAKLSHSRTLSASTRSDIRSRTLPEAVARPARPLSKGATALVDNPALKKPEFNSYKQHFSPKKTKQVPSSTSTLSRSGGGGGSSSEASAEGRHLQDELLQLTLLHDTAATTLRAYQKSITLQLSAWSDDLSQQLQTLASLEGESQAKANAYVAKSWLHAGREQRSTTSAASNRLLVLAHSIRELTCITKPFGPLDSVMRLFEEWQISAASTSPNGASLSQLAPLDPQWSDRLTSVQKRVQTCADSLADLQGPSVSSSIGLLIHMHSRLADQVLQEIAICRDIEVLILRREQEWMEAAVTRALSEVEGHGYGQASHLAERKGIWDRREEDQLPRR